MPLFGPVSPGQKQLWCPLLGKNAFKSFAIDSPWWTGAGRLLGRVDLAPQFFDCVTLGKLFHSWFLYLSPEDIVVVSIS